MGLFGFRITQMFSNCHRTGKSKWYEGQNYIDKSNRGLLFWQLVNHSRFYKLGLSLGGAG